MSPDYFLLPVALILLIAAAISMEKRGDSKTNSWMHTFGCWTAIIIAVWMLTWWGFHYVYNHDKLSTWIPPNEFGDMFGALTCLFSGIAIAGVIAMLRQQHEEMKETRDEFAAQTKQFEEQTQQFKEQIELARQAQLRDDFYRRISILQQLEESIAYTYKKRNPTRNNEEYDVTEYGIEAIAHFYKNNARILDAIKENYSTLPYIAADGRTHNETLLVWKQNVLDLLDDVKGIKSHKEIILSRLSSHGKALIVFLSPDKPGTKKLFQPSDFPDELPGKKTLEYYHKIISIKLQHHIHGERARNRVTKFILDNPPPPKPQS